MIPTLKHVHEFRLGVNGKFKHTQTCISLMIIDAHDHYNKIFVEWMS